VPKLAEQKHFFKRYLAPQTRINLSFAALGWVGTWAEQSKNRRGKNNQNQIEQELLSLEIFF
jgi:hypothetical protein